MSSEHSARAVVITVSDRASRGEREDTTGPLIQKHLSESGFTVDGKVIPDGRSNVEVALRSAVTSGARIVITTGGTGISPRDETPEGALAVIDQELPGVAQAVTARGLLSTPFAALSRCVVGVTRRPDGVGVLIATLPGSSGGVKDGLAVLVPLLPHILDQLAGGDH